VTTILTVVGARPQFVKAAPVSRELRTWAAERIVHTGQHYDPAMSKVFFDELDIPAPDVDLGVGSGSHGMQTGRMLEAVEAEILERPPDLVVVYGDTNSTLAGALAAAKLNVPVAHVEAGLRSGRKDMPEEINRIIVDHVSDLLLAPTETAVEHLAAEGIDAGVVLTGDVMVDALERVRPRLSADRVIALGVEHERYLLATVHRAETVDDPERLRTAVELLGSLELPVVVPVHPRTSAAMERESLSWPDGVAALAPVGYLDMLSLVAHAEAVLTDSGGLQKEAVLLGTRCLTLRPETEWPETLAGGWNTVVDLRIELVRDALARPHPIGRPGGFPPGAAKRVSAAIRRFLGR